MHNLLFGISLSALLSTTSLFIVVLRVSPLTAPEQAIPAFFMSLFLSVSTVGALLLYALWKVLPVHTWDIGKLLSISLRQGIFLGCATVILMLFHLLQLLNWWVGLMIYGVFIFIELALDH
tara:strand:+ start:220 stop:582 length:363 start_codon:yes stop_codon:yes gene_type:complete